MEADPSPSSSKCQSGLSNLGVLEMHEDDGGAAGLRRWAAREGTSGGLLLLLLVVVVVVAVVVVVVVGEGIRGVGSDTWREDGEPGTQTRREVGKGGIEAGKQRWC
ncbi:hypothetical protein E2C01_082768 [Portunus trituberculatus]|uniref:Uncharacterized protein n=1 Tax=Portunus trituberculatus TaxID=210409 RepID=A0A5B7J4N1_PORTR|nr:hypothetical protein [Portunus trituberculatus]